MPYFKVDQLFELSFSNKLEYVLPDSVKEMLVELESCLEITDVVVTETTDKKEYKSSDIRRQHNNNANDSNFTQKFRNRYDVDASTTANRGGPRDKDRKKGDFRQKDAGTSEWRSSAPASSLGGGGGSKEEAESDTHWEMMRSFKATKIESKTGIEKTVNDVRIALNKISAANYDKQRDAIMVLVNGYFASTEDLTEDNTRRISKAIFDIASTNKFYSEIYAKLYKELIEAQSIFRDLLEELISGFIALDTIPVYIDPDADYDGFCAYSKACEIRKSTSTFLVNCLKLELIAPSRIADILCEFVNYVECKRVKDGFAKCVEEIVENIYIIVTLCSKELSKTPKWQKCVLNKIKQFVADKNDGFPSMSNRATFKFMDILEKV